MKFTTALVAAFAVVDARYKSGAVTGFEKFTYGKFIARIKAPNKKGTVSSFFTYWNGPNFYPGGWNELDVEIVPSVDKNPFSMNIIYGDGHSKRESHDYVRSFDPKDDWHIYEMAWTPSYIAWSLDGKEVRRVTGEDPAVKFMTKGQSVMMNFWTPTFDSWGKGFNDKDMPWYVYYDYVETYTYNAKTKGFDFHWKDDFNTFDSNRWHKSDNTTFDANSTTFRASQSYVLNGNLVLKMEPDTYADRHGDIWDPTHVVPVQTEPTHDKVHPGEEHHEFEFGHHGFGEDFHHQSAPWGDYHHGGYGQFGYGQPGFPGYGYPGFAGYGAPWDHQGFTPYGGYDHGRWGTSHEDMHGRPDTPYYHAYPHPPEHFSEHHEEVHHEGHPPAPPKADKKKNTELSHYGDVYGAHHFQQDGVAAHDPHTTTHGHHYANDPIVNFYADSHHDAHATAHDVHHADSLHPSWDLPHHDLTPYEYSHHEDPHHAEPVHGADHHDFAHFDAGYWDLKGHEPHLGDHGHFEGETHGQYHYLDRGVDGHSGTYYGYLDEREHHPAHVDDYHNTHGIEHHPDDWVADVHHPDVFGTHIPHFDIHHGDAYHSDTHHHDEAHDDHHDVHGDHHYGHGSDFHPTFAGDGYQHNYDYHHGTQIVHDIEHSYDELFHDIERQVHHGVEHHEVEYAVAHDDDPHDWHPHGVDYHYDAPHHDLVHDMHDHHDAHHDAHHDIPHVDDHHDIGHHDPVVIPHHTAAPEKKEEDKKEATPVGKNLAYKPRGDHYALHHNGSTGRFVQ